jgi:type I restriction enzyme S subunit
MAGEARTYSVVDLIGRGVLAINDGYRAKNSELADHGIPFARAQNINDGFHFEDADRFPKAALERIGNKISEPGDVVFTSKGTVGRLAFVRSDTPRFVYAPQLCFWRSLDRRILEPRWLYYWMHSREFFVQYKGVAGQTDMADYVSLGDQRRMSMTFPALAEQQAIACILGALDDKIELNRRMNRTLEGLARAIFQSWFVNFGPVRAKAAGNTPPGLAPHVAKLFPDAFENSDLGEIPQGWSLSTVGECLSLSREALDPAEFPEEEFDHLSIPAFDAGKTPARDLGASIKSQKFVVGYDCVLVSKLNPRTPRVWMPPPDVGRRRIASTEFFVCIGDAKRHISREFVYCLATNPLLIEHLTTHATGTSNSHQRARPNDFLAFQFKSPTEQVLREFTQFVRPMFGRIETVQAESATLGALRDTLLPKLISGELRVPDAERIVGRMM